MECDADDEAQDDTLGDDPAEALSPPLKCPAPVRAAIKRAIAEHLQQHGRRNWALVYERPEFAPYIGKAAGPSAHRKFGRWVNGVARPRPKDKTRPHEDRAVTEAHEAWAKVEAKIAAAGMRQPIAVAPRHFMANGKRTIAGYAELGRIIADGFDDIERVRARALIDDPTGLAGQSAADPELLLKVQRAVRDLVGTAISLFREFNAIFAREAFNHALVEMLGEVLSSHPELREKVMKAFHDLICEFGGVPGQAGVK